MMLFMDRFFLSLLFVFKVYRFDAQNFHRFEETEKKSFNQFTQQFVIVVLPQANCVYNDVGTDL